MLKIRCLLFLGLISSLPIYAAEKVLINCGYISSFYVPDFYKWMKDNHYPNVNTLINILEQIPYEKKLERLSQFCQRKNINQVAVNDNYLLKEALNTLLLNSDAKPISFFQRMDYDPTQNQPEMSYHFETKNSENPIFIVKTRTVPMQWQEECLTYDKQSLKFSDCFSSQLTHLHLIFQEGTSKFQIRHLNSCLSIAGSTHWETCDASNPSQIFERVQTHNLEESQYLKFQILNTKSGKSILDNEFFYIRDVFPLIKINPPIESIPTQEAWTSFIQDTEFSSNKKNKIVLVWLDAIRADVISPEITPHLYKFAKQSVRFAKHFAGATATRGTGFTLWNSRPATEWMHFTKQGYLSKGSLNLNILKNLGYNIQAFGSILAVIDENLFKENGGYVESIEDPLREAYKDHVVISRSVFDYEQASDSQSMHSILNSKFYAYDNQKLDMHTVRHFQQELKKKRTGPQAYVFWLNGAHNPYISYAEQLQRPLFHPSFNPHHEDSYTGVQLPLWYNWFLNTGLQNPDALINSYLNAVSTTDALFGRIIQALKDAGQYDDSLIVAFGDHGESLFENTQVGHGGPPMQKVIETPIFYKFPNSEIDSSFVKTDVGTHMDIFPTIFDYLELNELEGYKNMVQGHSIFEETQRCYISTEPNGYGYHAIEFALYDGDQKMRVRYRNKERTLNSPKESEHPLYSRYLEVLSITDYEDKPSSTLMNFCTEPSESSQSHF